MRSLLRADWLRLRRRRDLWIIAIAVCVLGVLSFLAGYRSDVVDPIYPDAAQIRQEAIDFSYFEGTPAEIEAQIDEMVQFQLEQNRIQLAEWETQQRISLQKYAFPQSLFTILGSAILPILTLVLIASLAVGDEFRFGTIRTSLLAAGDRRRFLAARFVSLLAMTVGLFVVLLLLGSVLGLGLGLIGADLGAGAIAIDAPSAAALVGAQVLATMVLIALATALTVLLRSGALPLLLILIGALMELFVANLPVFAPTELLSAVPQAFLIRSIQTLVGTLGLGTHAIALSDGSQLPHQAFALPMLGVAGVVAAWGLLFVIAADRRLRTMDVVE